CFFFSSRRRHTRCLSDWSSDVCSSDLMFDPRTLDTLASMTLPPRDPSSGKIFNDFAAGGYFYLDNRDRVVVLTNDKHLYVIKERSEERRVGKEGRSGW